MKKIFSALVVFMALAFVSGVHALSIPNNDFEFFSTADPAPDGHSNFGLNPVPLNWTMFSDSSSDWGSVGDTHTDQSFNSTRSMFFNAISPSLSTYGFFQNIYNQTNTTDGDYTFIVYSLNNNNLPIEWTKIGIQVRNSTGSTNLVEYTFGTGAGCTVTGSGIISSQSCSTTAVPASSWEKNTINLLATTADHSLNNITIIFTRFFENDGSTGSYWDNLSLELVVAAPADTTPPAVAIQSPTGTYTETQDLPSYSKFLNFTASDALGISVCKYQLNGAANVTIPSCANGTLSLARGVYSLKVFANDTAGNTGNASSSFTIQLAPRATGNTAAVLNTYPVIFGLVVLFGGALLAFNAGRKGDTSTFMIGIVAIIFGLIVIGVLSGLVTTATTPSI